MAIGTAGRRFFWATSGPHQGHKPREIVRNARRHRESRRGSESRFPLVVVLKPLRMFGAGCRSRTDDLLITNLNQGVDATWTYGPK